MFSRNSSSSYSNLGGGATKPSAPVGRRAFRDVTNANGSSNNNSSKSRMHAGNDKKLKYQAPKIEVMVDPNSRPYSSLGRAVNETKQNPLIPASKHLPLGLKAKTVSAVSQPRVTNLTSARASYQYTGKVDNIDERCVDDPLCATDYVQDMYEIFRKKEGLTAVLPVYMEDTQPHINEKMRSILVDWLIEVHMKFKLVPETLFLTINLIDRYLEREAITRSNLQLLGVGCLLIATKYEEIYPPSVNELVYICDNAYTRTTIIKMETQILRTFNYQITQPSAHTFLVRYLKAAHADREMSALACYLLDGTLQSYSMLSFLPSQLAAAAVFLARHASGRNPWSPTLLKYAEYTEEDVAPIARALLAEKSAMSPDLHSLHKKYSSHKYGGVASKPLTFDF